MRYRVVYLKTQKIIIQNINFCTRNIHDLWYNIVCILIDTELSARLNQDFSLFHRPNKPKFDHFTSKQEELVNTAIEHVSQQLYDTLGTTYNIAEYISTH